MKGKKKLRRQLGLLAIGAAGYECVEDDPDSGLFVFQTIGAEAFSRWANAIGQVWRDDLGNRRLCLADAESFESLDSATDYLWALGCRAKETP